MLVINALNKDFFGNNQCRQLFSSFNLKINNGDRIGLFAPNGCGKSTLFNIITGIDNEFTGHVDIHSKRFSYMVQDPKATLLPWYNCKKNILLLRKYHGMSIDSGNTLLNELAGALEVKFPLGLYPFQLSGGQCQIVSLLRALIIEPDFLIMDEPFSALDAKKRLVVKELLNQLFKNNITVLICSHRREEVCSLLNRSIVLKSESVTSVLEDFCEKDFNNRREFEQYVSKIDFNLQKNKYRTSINGYLRGASFLADNCLDKAV